MISIKIPETNLNIIASGNTIYIAKEDIVKLNLNVLQKVLESDLNETSKSHISKLLVGLNTMVANLSVG